ncbi:MAG TPA: hypothetical protein VK158_04030, partial [Acidobacteriota bacterium]|nr:hypothetical protein [Acidobacteriota bacterium]
TTEIEALKTQLSSIKQDVNVALNEHTLHTKHLQQLEQELQDSEKNLAAREKVITLREAQINKLMESQSKLFSQLQNERTKVITKKINKK